MTNEELKKKVEPDGWCARHNVTDVFVLSTIAVSKDACVNKCGGVVTSIEPVWLSDTPPVSKEVLEKLKVYLWKHAEGIHYYCEDSWYSCPAHLEGCANEALGEKCNCGAEDKAQEAADLLVELNLLPDEQPK